MLFFFSKQENKKLKLLLLCFYVFFCKTSYRPEQKKKKKVESPIFIKFSTAKTFENMLEAKLRGTVMVLGHNSKSRSATWGNIPTNSEHNCCRGHLKGIGRTQQLGRSLIRLIFFVCFL